MANYQLLKADIDTKVYQNGQQEITGENLNSVLNAMVTTLGAEYQFAGVATIDTNPGTPDAKVFYIAKGKGTYTNFGGLQVTEDDVVVLYWDTAWHKEATGIASQEKITELDDIIPNLYKDTFYISDSAGYVIAKIDSNGITTVDIQDGNGNKLSQIVLKLSEIEQEIQRISIQGILPEHYKSELYITDESGNIIAKFDSNGIETTNIKADNVAPNHWLGKVLATYGDSVTAINNGDFTYPYNFNGVAESWRWGNRVAQYLKMAKHYGRGIGGQQYNWRTHGGSLSWVGATGANLNRVDAYTYDDYLNPELRSTVLAKCEQAGYDANTMTLVRGSLSSWLRITKMFPASIKDEISVITVMCHNDYIDGTALAWVVNDTTDPEWAASGEDYYGKVNGDYNINTFRGGLASTIMKLQLWMPNAIIVVCTPISGQGQMEQLNPSLNPSLYGAVGPTKEIAAKMSMPVIDVFNNDGINGINRTTYIADNIHPYSVPGSKMIARAIVGGLITILPYDSMNF